MGRLAPLRIVAVFAVAAALLTAVGRPTGRAGAEGAPPVNAGTAPVVTVACDVDVCSAEVTYVLDDRRDGHPIAVRWDTEPAVGFDDNAPDVVIRSGFAGTGQQVAGGFRYSASDVIWHSDIRCDDTVQFRVRIERSTPTALVTGKDVPAEPASAYCSDYGMADERTLSAGRERS